MSQSGDLSRSQVSRPLSFTGALAAALALPALGHEALAQQGSALMQGMPNDVRIGPVARYATPDGQLRFVFDRSGVRVALLRFEGDPEVHVLRPRGAAGGDEIYANEAGDIMLRVTPSGGVSVYTRRHRTGVAAAEEAAAAPLTPQALAIAQYQARMRALQLAAARALRRQIIFEAPASAAGANAGLIIDAAERAAASLSQAPTVVVRRVVIRAGPIPAARMEGEALNIQVAPQMGYAGRPSSSAISAVLTGHTVGPER